MSNLQPKTTLASLPNELWFMILVSTMSRPLGPTNDHIKTPFLPPGKILSLEDVFNFRLAYPRRNLEIRDEFLSLFASRRFMFTPWSLKDLFDTSRHEIFSKYVYELRFGRAMLNENFDMLDPDQPYALQLSDDRERWSENYQPVYNILCQEQIAFRNNQQGIMLLRDAMCDLPNLRYIVFEGDSYILKSRHARHICHELETEALKTTKYIFSTRQDSSWGSDESDDDCPNFECEAWMSILKALSDPTYHHIGLSLELGITSSEFEALCRDIFSLQSIPHLPFVRIQLLHLKVDPNLANPFACVERFISSTKDSLKILEIARPDRSLIWFHRYGLACPNKLTTLYLSTMARESAALEELLRENHGTLKKISLVRFLLVRIQCLPSAEKDWIDLIRIIAEMHQLQSLQMMQLEHEYLSTDYFNEQDKPEIQDNLHAPQTDRANKHASQSSSQPCPLIRNPCRFTNTPTLNDTTFYIQDADEGTIKSRLQTMLKEERYDESMPMNLSIRRRVNTLIIFHRGVDGRSAS